MKNGGRLIGMDTKRNNLQGNLLQIYFRRFDVFFHRLTERQLTWLCFRCPSWDEALDYFQVCNNVKINILLSMQVFKRQRGKVASSAAVFSIIVAERLDALMSHKSPFYSAQTRACFNKP